jgi:hypothetical protein
LNLEVTFPTFFPNKALKEFSIWMRTLPWPRAKGIAEKTRMKATKVKRKEFS